MIETTLNKLLDEGTVGSGEALVVNTIPLTAERFARARSWFGRRNDFLGSQFPKHIRWSAYKEYFVEHILAEIEEIYSKRAATIDYDVSWEKFKSALNACQYKVYFLLAHHIEREDSIEFADGPVHLAEMFAYFEQLDGLRRKSVNFFICKADKFSELKQEKVASIGSVTVAFWNLPVRACYRFVRYWTVNIKESGSLSQAYSQSIKQFFHDNFPAHQ